MAGGFKHLLLYSNPVHPSVHLLTGVSGLSRSRFSGINLISSSIFVHSKIGRSTVLVLSKETIFFDTGMLLAHAL